MSKRDGGATAGPEVQRDCRPVSYTHLSQFLLEVLKNSSNEGNYSEKVNADKDSLNSSISQSEVRVHHNFWESYQQIVSKKVEGNEKSSSAYEFEAYCASSVINQNDDPFMWWQQNCTRYPEMAHIAKIYL